MSALFVAGAGTDIGKTYVTAAIARALRAAGRPVAAFKPVASGVPPFGDPAFAQSDTAILLDAQRLPLDRDTVERCSPWRFEAPLSPDMAAEAEGQDLDLDDLVGWTRRAIGSASPGTAVLIEGAGGLMSPVCRRATGLDWLAALDCPALLVVGSYLGALSHALTAVEALRARGVVLSGMVVNETPGSPVGLTATVQSLERFAPGALILALRRGEAAGPELAALADPISSRS